MSSKQDNMTLDAVWLISAGLLACSAQVAHATQYLTQEQAQQALFPQASEFRRTVVMLSDAQNQAIRKVSKTRTPLPLTNIWQVFDGDQALGWVIVDEVFGKHEFITYALGISADGNVTGVEIMDYRETHGYEVREADWRQQFVGKRYGDPLKLEKDIKNISGATLSCLHLSDGVRRLLALHEQALQSQG